MIDSSFDRQRNEVMKITRKCKSKESDLVLERSPSLSHESVASIRIVRLSTLSAVLRRIASKSNGCEAEYICRTLVSMGFRQF